eukprot:scaffold55112_cov54-Phaeocystis_antarctica.AAC.2
MVTAGGHARTVLMQNEAMVRRTLGAAASCVAGIKGGVFDKAVHQEKTTQHRFTGGATRFYLGDARSA